MQTPWPEDIGRVARQRRLDLNLSQEYLAHSVGVSRQWLSRFESARTDVSLAKALLVLRELDLRVDVSATRQMLTPVTTDSMLARRIAQISERVAIGIEANACREVSLPGLSATARAALEKLADDPIYIRAAAGLGVGQILNRSTPHHQADDRVSE